MREAVCVKPEIGGGRGGSADFPVAQRAWVIYFELQPVKTAGDRGYDYNRVMQYDQD